MNFNIVECEGFNRKDAFENAKLNFDPMCPLIKGTNCTTSWYKAGKPPAGSLAFRRFAIQQLNEKTHNEPGYGLYIILKSFVDDRRKKPFTIINNKVVGLRNWITLYQLREDKLDINLIPVTKLDYNGDPVTEDDLEIKIKEEGPIIETFYNKAEGLKRMKELIIKNHKSYSLIPIKFPDSTPIAAFGIYTPSIKAKKGVFVAWGIDREIE